VKLLLIIPLFLFVLVACSSPTSQRAPVYDAKANEVIKNNVTIYTPGNKIVNKNNYTVRSGDTMYSIAWRAGIDVKVLIKRNKLKKPYIIHTGEVLKLRESTAKIEPHSQKKQKSSSVKCKSQNCRKNAQIKVVKKATTEYHSVNGENIIKNKLIKSPKKKKQVNVWRWPSKGKLTKTFANSVQGMKGVSISNVRGTPVFAAASGQVVYAGSGLSGYGNLIIIKHNYDYLSAYAHNETLMIKEGEQVKAGQKIAVMGDSGTDTVRLHFDIRFRGKSVDPLRYLPKRR